VERISPVSSYSSSPFKRALFKVSIDALEIREEESYYKVV